jgi:hypothetical protein
VILRQQHVAASEHVRKCSYELQSSITFSPYKRHNDPRHKLELELVLDNYSSYCSYSSTTCLRIQRHLRSGRAYRSQAAQSNASKPEQSRLERTASATSGLTWVNALENLPEGRFYMQTLHGRVSNVRQVYMSGEPII